MVAPVSSVSDMVNMIAYLMHCFILWDSHCRPQQQSFSYYYTWCLWTSVYMFKEITHVQFLCSHWKQLTWDQNLSNKELEVEITIYFVDLDCFVQIKDWWSLIPSLFSMSDGITVSMHFTEMPSLVSKWMHRCLCKQSERILQISGQFSLLLGNNHWEQLRKEKKPVKEGWWVQMYCRRAQNILHMLCVYRPSLCECAENICRAALLMFYRGI